jgi:hypothetical protein
MNIIFPRPASVLLAMRRSSAYAANDKELKPKILRIARLTSKVNSKSVAM